jgi:hypothetical protein
LKRVDLPTLGRPTIPALSMARDARVKTSNCKLKLGILHFVSFEI